MPTEARAAGGPLIVESTFDPARLHEIGLTGGEKKGDAL